MGTDVRIPPERVAAVSVGVLWGRKHHETRPELLPVTEVGIVVVDRSEGEPLIERRELLEGADLRLVPEHLGDLGLPVVTFNGLRFDWVALGALTEVDTLIPRTIDLYSALYPCVSTIVDAEGVSAFPVRGEYGVLHPHRVAETNLGFVPGDSDPVGDAELTGALWNHFLTHERAVAAGRTHVLSDESLEILAAERPAIASADDWRAMLSGRPEPTPYRRKTRHQVTFPRIDQRYV
ncbi:MAG: hypothetical protein QM648_10975 [Solirubrobacterales bacterium]